MSSAITSVSKRAARPNVANLVKQAIKPKGGIKDLVKGGKVRGPQAAPFRASRGHDPECFLQRVADGHIVSSIPILMHDKHDPIDLGDGIVLFADNCLAETSFPPYQTKEEMLSRIKTVFTRIQEHIGPDYRLLPQAAHTFAEGELEIVGQFNPFEVGCTPSFNAHLASIEMMEPFTDLMRSGSCHLHIGNLDWQAKKHNGKVLTFDSRHETIMLLDIFVGLASVIWDRDPSSLTRRNRYGKCSSFRPCPYGAEWRVMGNACLRTPALMELMYDCVTHALSHVAANQEKDVLAAIDFDKVTEAVNTCNPELARDLLTKAEMPSDLMARIHGDYGTQTLNEAWAI